MREIKFRGKSVEDGHWVYGYYVHLTDYFRNREIHRIYTGLSDSCPSVKDKYDFFPDTEEVDEDTIGQFTGLFDKNGKEIYEGDIVKVRITDDRFKSNPKYKNMIVFFDEDRGRFDVKLFDCFRTKRLFDCFRTKRLEVIGNVVDNHELLKGGQE